MARASKTVGLLPVHPLIQVAHVIAQHIHDYPSLICFSLACHGFRDAVHGSPTRLASLFDMLEMKKAYGPNCDCAFCSMPFFTTHTACVYSTEDSDDDQFDNPQRALTYDLVRFNHEQLLSGKWIPCYGCRTLKPQHHFLTSDSSFVPLFASYTRRRRCIPCRLAGDTPSLCSSTWNARWMVGFTWDTPVVRTYLVAMPEEAGGFCLRCSHCRRAEWLQRPPCKKQRRKEMCRVCFVASRAAARISPDDLFQDEWRRLLALMPVRTGAERRARIPEIELMVEIHREDVRLDSWLTASNRFQLLDSLDSD